jgi:hypothetical protein
MTEALVVAQADANQIDADSVSRCRHSGESSTNLEAKSPPRLWRGHHERVGVLITGPGRRAGWRGSATCPASTVAQRSADDYRQGKGEDLKDLGITSVGHRRRLLEAIAGSPHPRNKSPTV